ncbi:MAG: elongation factor G [Proteobacteria bacterium]|nr:elongation factor G [Desulfobulbaceae bacterium]MBU4151369.1 elongation factor G [Pseudomonadota bacterium]
MKESQTIRNIGLFGHSKCGKTSLAEALLFTSGKINRLGKVDEGTSCMDFEQEEIQHNLTISAAFNHFEWAKHTVFLTDTPGDDNFLNDTYSTAQVVDSAIFIIGAVLGVKHQTEKFVNLIQENQLPGLIFINKMDRERADFKKTIGEINDSLPMKTAVLHLPIGAEANFKGVVDILTQEAYLFDGTTGKVKKGLIPKDMQADVASYREQLMEMVAETDDALIEKFLEEGVLLDDDLQQGLIQAVKSAKLYPIVVGSALNNYGTEPLLNAIIDILPSPLDRPAAIGINPKTNKSSERQPSPSESFSAIVFKTMADPYAGRLSIMRVISGTLSNDSFYNASKETPEKFGQLLLLEGKGNQPTASASPGMIVAVAKLKETTTGHTLCDEANPIVYPVKSPLSPVVSYAVTTSKKDSEDKLFSSITKMLEEDPTLRLTREPQTNEILLSGVGQIHLKILGEKIKRKYGVEMELQPPKVPYRETIKGKARVQYKHKKQSGGRGQYADNWLEIEPMPRGEGYLFEDRIVGGVIPKQYIPAVDKGVQEAMANGVLAGYPVVDLKVGLVDGSFHNVDSSEMAFKISGSMAFKKGVMEATPILLEPISNLTIQVPKECVGDVIGDLNSRRGKVMGMDSESKLEVIKAQAPMAEILEYAPTLTAITGGRGLFFTDFSHYQEVPAHLTHTIIAATKEAA